MIVTEITTPFTIEELSDNTKVLYEGYLISLADTSGGLLLNQTTPQSIINGQPIQDILTASELVSTDSNKKLSSLPVATHPSLTEISFVKGLTSAVQTQINGKQASGNYYNKDSDNATDILLNKVGSPDYETLQDLSNGTIGAGIIAGVADHIITDGGLGTVDFSAINGIIKTTNESNGANVFFKIAALAGVSLTDNSLNYILINYNSGTPIYEVSLTDTSNGQTIIKIGKVYREGTGLDILHTGLRLSNLAYQVQHTVEYLHGLNFLSGGIVSEVGTRNIHLTAGIIGYGFHEDNSDVFDTYTGGDTYEYYYYNGSAWIETDETQIDNFYYNDISSGLVELTPNRYSNAWIFKGSNSNGYVVYGQGSYTLAQAQAAQPPAILPEHVSSMGVLRAKIIIQKSASVFTEIQSVEDTMFIFSTPSNHNELGGLQGGTADEYNHLTSAQHTVATQAATDALNGYATSTQITKLDGIEATAEVNNISDVNATALTDGGETALHSHAGGAAPVYYDIGTAADNEINLLLSDELANVCVFTVTVTDAVNYIVELYGSAGALLRTQIIASGAACSVPIPNGLGVDSGTNFTSYKCRIYASNAAKAITIFAVSATAANTITILKARFGTTGLTSLASGLKAAAYLNECILPATLDSTTTLANCFDGCLRLTSLTMPTSMTALTTLSQTFTNCYLLSSITLPATLNLLTTMANMCANSFLLATITMPTSANILTSLSYSFQYCPQIISITLPATLNSLTTMFGMCFGCSSLVTLTLPTSATALTGNGLGNFIKDCYSLETLTEITTINANQIDCSGNVWLNALTVFDQSALRCSKLLLNGQNAANTGALASIEIDWANSTYGGAAPQLDLRFNNLSAVEIDRIFTALPTIAKTINVASNPGAATCTTSIATDKTWTVVIS